MAPRSNIHTHTAFSDGKNAPQEMAEAALKLGFHTLGFSDHGHADYDDCSMSAAAEPEYRREILRLKAAYAGRLHILLGYERDWLSGADISPYDYAIESVHYVSIDGALVCVDDTPERLMEGVRLCGGDPYRLCRAYFRTVAACCAGGARVLGHMDLVAKFNGRRPLFDEADPRYLACALEAADAAADSGMLIEVNTGAIARGWRAQPYPAPAILRHLAKRRAPVVITSDCHDARFLDCAFRETAERLRACGFQTAVEARGDDFEEYAL